MGKAAPVIELTPEMVAGIERWEQIKTEIERLKALEIKQRLELITGLPFATDKEEGAQTLKLNAGWKLVMDRGMAYTADKAQAVVVAGLNELGAVNPVLTADLIRWEAVVSVSNYKKLTDAEKVIAASFITMKPGTPSLVLKPPPEPKG